MTFSITAMKREAGEAEEIRSSGRIPGVLYGPEIEPVSLSVDYQTFEKLYNEAGESSLIDFSVEGNSGEPTKVLVQDVQYNSLQDKYTHVDFRQIKMGEEMHATIELTFVGESDAVKSQGGTLIQQRDTLEVKCLPKDLVNHIDVDLSVLATFEDAIHISDLPVPAGITILDNPEGLVAKVSAPLTEDQLNALEESQVGDVAEVEVAKEKKEDGEDAEEGKKEKKEDKE